MIDKLAELMTASIVLIPMGAWVLTELGAL